MHNHTRAWAGARAWGGGGGGLLVALGWAMSSTFSSFSFVISSTVGSSDDEPSNHRLQRNGSELLLQAAQSSKIGRGAELGRIGRGQRSGRTDMIL